jgi:hypothetical protein
VNNISTDLLHHKICHGNETNKINKALGKKTLLWVPHWPHDKRFMKNGNTSGLLETTVQSNIFSDYIDQRKSLPMSHGGPYNDPSSMAPHFGINVDTVATILLIMKVNEATSHPKLQK